MAKLKIVSLFCGCGGTDVGMLGGFKYLNLKYKKLNTKIIYANDIDNKICQIFNANFKINAHIKDIKDTKSSEVPNHDILTGGFPCQSFSIVAQNPPRLGFKDEKGKLFFEMVRILKKKRPKAFIAENVKGILSANKGLAFPLIIREFEKTGYNVSWKLLNSADFGIPQKRERVFIIGIRKKYKKTFLFPESVFNSENYIKLSSVINLSEEIDEKYFFSERALQGLIKSNKKMNKGRIQKLDKPCNTVGAHLAKVSLNSTDPVLKINGRIRRFTPDEVARIQSFPTGFKLIGSDTIKYKALGNAIPPVLMWHVGKSLIKQLETR